MWIECSPRFSRMVFHLSLTSRRVSLNASMSTLRRRNLCGRYTCDRLKTLKFFSVPLDVPTDGAMIGEDRCPTNGVLAASENAVTRQWYSANPPEQVTWLLVLVMEKWTYLQSQRKYMRDWE